MMFLNRPVGSLLLVFISLLGLVAGVVFLVLASRFFASPDDRAAAPESFVPLTYLRMRPFDSAGYLAFSEASAATAGDGAQRLRSHALRAATLLAPVDPQVIRADAALAFSSGNIRGGLEKTAKLAAISPMDLNDAFNVLAAYVTHPAWRDFAASQLKAGWPVSDQFLLKLCNDSALAQHAFAVASHFARFRPLSSDATHCAENRAIAAGDVQGAYRLRLNAAQTLPTRIGYVFNGSFELPVSGSVFDWILEPGGEFREGFVAAIRPDTGFGGVSKALVIRFTGRSIRPPIAQQYLALPQGRYELSYVSQQTAQIGTKSPNWVLRCTGSGTPLIIEPWTESAVPGGWGRRRVPFTVGVNCAGQTLSLEPKTRLSALEGLQGTLVIDDVTIERR